jgi:hypothetical protein
MDIPAFVIVRDLVDWTKQVVAALEAAGVDELYLVDNDSTYEPLLEWYDTQPHAVIRLGANYGKFGPWTQGPLLTHTRGRRFLLTDPDVIPKEDCPLDWVEHFGDVLDAHPDLQKVGFSLEINDLPRGYEFRDEVLVRNRPFWHDDLLVADVGYRVVVDTTLALYRGGAPYCTRPAMRTLRPYVARHMAWYINSRRPPLDVRYYRARAADDFGHWAKAQLPDRLRSNLHRGVKGVPPQDRFRQQLPVD